jgi:hypothetical protein
VEFFKFYYDTYGCNQIIMLKYIIEEQEVEINHDPLLTNRSVSVRGDQINSR